MVPACLMTPHQGMFTASLAVRLHARAICGVLGIKDAAEVDRAVKRLSDEQRVEQLVLIAHPRGVFKQGSSGALQPARSLQRSLLEGRRCGCDWAGWLCVRVVCTGSLAAALSIVAAMTGRRLRRLVASTADLTLR